MSVATDVAAFFRNQWADRFEDTCAVKRAGSETFNSTTGVYETTYSTTYSGPCLIRPSANDDAQAGEQQAEIRFYTVFVPYTTTNVVPDDLVDVTSAHDDYLNGLQFVVRNVAGDTYNHVRKLRCEEVVNG